MRTTYSDLQKAERQLREAGLAELVELLEELEQRRDSGQPAVDSDGTDMPGPSTPVVERESGEEES